MSVRSFFGMCEHKWQPLGDKVIQTSQVRICDGKKFVTGFTQPRECEKCGAVKGFPLS